MWGEVVKRPLITAGFLSFVLMIPLAATSTDRMVRRLGGKRWQQLHRAVYLVAVAGAVHFWWLVKLDITRPLIYAVIVGALLVARLVFRLQRNGLAINAAQNAARMRHGKAG